MAVFKRDMVDINLETGNIHRSFLKHSIGLEDNEADHFGIRVFRDGEEVDLTGVSVQGYFRNPQGTNIAITSGNIVSGNEAEVVLPQACYAYEGQFCLSIKLVGGGVTGTIRIVDGMVDNANTGSVVAPTETVPTYQEVLAVYDAMVDATAAANTAIAETFDATKAYPAGKYVINDGALYRLTADHAANVTWANTSKVAAKIGDDVDDLKSAIKANKNSTENSFEQVTGNRAMVFVPGYYKVGSDKDVIDITAPETSNATAKHMVTSICPCQPGDVFTIKAYGGATTASAFGYLNASYQRIYRGGANGLVERTYTVPESITVAETEEIPAYFIVNNDTDYNPTDYYAYKGKSMIDQFGVDQIDFSNETVKSGRIVPETNKYGNTTGFRFYLLQVKDGWKRVMAEATASEDIDWRYTSTYIGFMTSNTVTYGEDAPFVTGESLHEIKQGDCQTLDIPDTCEYIYVLARNNGATVLPIIDMIYDDPNIAVKIITSLIDANERKRNLFDASITTTMFAGKKMSIIGDSVSAFNPPGFRRYYPYGDVKDVSQMWWNRIISSSGATLEVTKASSGSYVTDYLAEGETRDQFPTFYERCTGLGNPDMIFVELGANDAQQNVPLGDYDYETDYTELSESTFRTAYIKGISALRANYPNADIYCFIIAYTDKLGYVMSIRSIAEHFGIRYFDLSRLDYTKVQGAHPDDHGMRQIASAVMNASNDTETAFVNGMKKSIESFMGVNLINFQSDSYYETPTEDEAVNIITNPKVSANYRCAIVECQAGDEFTIVGEGGTGYQRLYGFFDSNNVCLERGKAYLSGKYVAIAPANAAYAVINLYQNRNGCAYVRRADIAEVNKHYRVDSDPLTQDFKFCICKDSYNDRQIQILRIVSKYTTSDDSLYPTVRYRLTDGKGRYLYTSPYYKIGSTVEMKQQEWRLPPYLKELDKYEVRIDIPSGVSVTVDSISIHTEAAHPYVGGIEFEAHHGFVGLYPPDTAIAMEAAGKLGFGYCTITPKFTSDEVAVCFHDDATIRGRLRYNDGTEITAGSADDKPMWEFTYADILDRFDAGRKTSPLFAGVKVPTVDEFFEICSKMGMNACMSIHSETGFNGYSGSDAGKCQTTTEEADERMQTIYNLAKKWGLLGRIYIKSGNAMVQARARNIFGKKAKYILIHGITSTWDPLTRAKEAGFVPSSATSMSESEYHVYMEWFETGVTDAKIETAKSEDFETLQIAEENNLSSEEMRGFIEKGITRFTLDHHCSMGLNW